MHFYIKIISKVFSAFILMAISVQGLAIPTIQTWQADNGAKVLFIETHALPMVDIRVAFAAGSARDDKHPGLALLTNALLSSGAGDYDANQIAEQLESVGAVLNNQALRDMAMLSLRSLSADDKLTVAIGVMQQVLNKPTFPVSDLERDKKRLLLAIKNKQQQPGSVAQDAFYEAIYQNHVYAQPSIGTVDSIAALQQQDIQEFYKQYYVGNNATIAIVGDIKRKQAESLVEKLMEDMPAGEKAPDLLAVDTLTENKTIKLPMPITQTHILIGQPGMRRGDEDFYALYVGNHILGGSGFASRLVQEIREDRGLAYSTYSYFLPMAQRGPFLAGMQTRNEQANTALEVMLNTISEFTQNGPSQAELDKAIQNIVGGFPLKIDSNSDLVEYLAMIGFYNLSLDYLKDFNKNIETVTIEKIQDAFKRRLNPEKLVVVMVGGEQEQPE